MRNLTNKSIIICDDDIEISNITKKIFENIGLHVILAPDEVTLFQITQEIVPHIFLIDILLDNDQCGLKILQKIKQDQVLKDVPVVICSEVNNEKIISKARELGFHEYLTKPISSKKYIMTVKKVLRQIEEKQVDFPANLEECNLNCEVKGILTKINEVSLILESSCKLPPGRPIKLQSTFLDYLDINSCNFNISLEVPKVDKGVYSNKIEICGANEQSLQKIRKLGRNE